MVSARRFFVFVTLLAACFGGHSVFADESDARTVLVRVRSVDGNRITLDDSRGTVVSINDRVRFRDERGEANFVTNLNPGDQVVLYIDRQTRYIRTVSSRREDIEAAGGSVSTPAVEEQPRASYRRVEKSVIELKSVEGEWGYDKDATINGRVFDKALFMPPWTGVHEGRAVFPNRDNSGERYDLFEAWIGFRGGYEGNPNDAIQCLCVGRWSRNL